MKPIPKIADYKTAEEYLRALLQYQKRYNNTLYKEGKLIEVQKTVALMRSVLKK